MENNSKINRTFKEQAQIEETINKIFKTVGFNIADPEQYNDEVRYNIEAHINFTKKHILSISAGYSLLDSGLPWFSYWILNIFNLTAKNKFDLSHSTKLQFVSFLKELQHPEGGFSGYSKGLPHIVSNYAAVMAIVSLGIKEGYDIIDREKMRVYLKKMKNNNKTNKNVTTDSKGLFAMQKSDNDNCSEYQAQWPGSFQMHVNGESDLRATYCGLTVAYVLNIIDDELLEGVIDNIKLCQTFEGGLGPEPYCEAHGGYSFCGIATLILFNKLDEINVNDFIRWLVNRQMANEGGFQGRTNKLVDSCYSFWQASVFNMLIMNGNELKYSNDYELLYDQLSLQAYILFACQYQNGGLIDKPGKKPDLFHTNYATAGLSLSQKSLLPGEFKLNLNYNNSLDLEDINPIFCVANDKYEQAKDYYWNMNN